MAKKKKTWLEIKATKPPEEWRRINSIYGKRHKLRNQLRVRAAELLDKIHNYRLVQSPGPADTLIDEVHKVLRLPYCWSQEDLDHAESRISDKINLAFYPCEMGTGGEVIRMRTQAVLDDMKKGLYRSINPALAERTIGALRH